MRMVRFFDRENNKFIYLNFDQLVSCVVSTDSSGETDSLTLAFADGYFRKIEDPDEIYRIFCILDVNMFIS